MEAARLRELLECGLLNILLRQLAEAARYLCLRFARLDGTCVGGVFSAFLRMLASRLSAPGSTSILS